MVRNRPFLLACLVVLSLLFVPQSLKAEKSAIKDLLVTADQTHLLLYARLTNCFTSDIEDAVLAGVPTTFTFIIHIFMERAWLPDKKIKSFEIHHTIKYDNIKKIFNVSIDDQKTWENFSDLDSAKKMMSDINALRLESLGALIKNKYYTVKLKAKLDNVSLPLHLEYLFFFVSFWDFETDWSQQRFLF
jgi:hypothetical protein